ncbi:M48 family metalloprotease [Candidatus Omnitrophota bacterium]
MVRILRLQGFRKKAMGRLSLLLVLLLLVNFIVADLGFCEFNLATGKEEAIFISAEKERKMGEAISRQVEKKMKLDKNYTNQEKVDRIGQKLAMVSDRRDIIYHFYVIDDETENAFALPGGYIYIFKGFLEKLETDDEIAAILAHEIGHVCAKHSLKRLQNSLGYTVLRLLVVRGAEDPYSRAKGNEAVNQLMLAHSRADETEADKLAAKYLEKAGFDPYASVDILDKMIKWKMKGPIRAKRYWYTHPYLADRRATARKEVTGELSFDDYLNVTKEEEYVF